MSRGAGAVRLAAMNLPAWVRHRGDLLLAAGLAIAALTQAAVSPIASLPLAVLIALVTTVPVAVRRTHPVVAALVTTAAGLIPSNGYVYVGYVVDFIVFYSVAVYVPRRRTVVAAVVAGVVLSAIGSAVHAAVFGDYFAALSAVVAPAVVGRFVRYQRKQSHQLQELTRQLERERELNVARALADERARIARELHDVVAHTMSVVAIQADAAEAVLDADPGRARVPLETIRRSATEALAEMRQLLTVLRADEPAGEIALAPSPGLDQLPALIDRARAAGVQVTLEVTGPAQSVPASLDLSAYRIIQEALTNVAKHAPGAPASILLDWRQDAVAIEIRNPGTSLKPAGTNGAGHGLIGMRERVRMLGGDFDAGEANGDGFIVSAVLPYRERSWSAS
jgi:signal transduction histidine kinase